MRIPIAIVIAGLLIATAVMLAFHWQISGTDNGVYRLDRWTGHVISCNLAACADIGSR
jgi:hypothetical protein